MVNLSVVEMSSDPGSAAGLGGTSLQDLFLPRWMLIIPHRAARKKRMRRRLEGKQERNKKILV
jgi:hypothetical protein